MGRVAICDLHHEEMTGVRLYHSQDAMCASAFAVNGCMQVPDSGGVGLRHIAVMHNQIVTLSQKPPL